MRKIASAQQQNLAVKSSNSSKSETGTLHFHAEARLLQELGERLVAVPEVALVELIKNAYDADATACRIEIDSHNSMTIFDDGHGMTFDQFQRFWMTIGTSHKAREEFSPYYARDLTGQKGIGRFAVRFLATKLVVTTTAHNRKTGKTTQLKALFDWVKLDKNEALSEIEVPYELKTVPPNSPTGTTLRLEGLRHDTNFLESKWFKTQVLRIVSPVHGLDRGSFGERFVTRRAPQGEDPGFKVLLPGESAEDVTNIAEEVLSNYVAKLTITGTKSHVTYKVLFESESKPHVLKVETKHHIENGFHADIRWYPKRKGLFNNIGINGTAAYQWVKENCGVSVIDRGFRMRPYGENDDDWLDIVADTNVNRRNWRTEIAEKHFPISTLTRNDPALNPMINLPTQHQLIGAVFVASSKRTSTTDITDLIPSTDREGFLKTIGFVQLKEFVRAGIEYIAHLDRIKGLERKQEVAETKARQARAEFQDAVHYVKTLPNLSEPERAKILDKYVELAAKVDETEQYEREARGKLSVMGAMGVLAGFLTHEASRLKETLQRAASDVDAAARKDPSLAPIANRLKTGVQVWNDQLEYVSTFIDSTQKYQSASFKSKPQVQRVIRLFSDFCEDRNIEIRYDIDANTMVPEMPVSTYSGIFLNLLTNALKAVMAHKKSKGKELVEVRAWSDSKYHVIEVLDTGIGVPPSMTKRIFDPLFTTTSRLDNSLGTGMGLGLTLSRQLAAQYDGTVELVEADDGFTTCFKVTFPFKAKKK